MGCHGRLARPRGGCARTRRRRWDATEGGASGGSLAFLAQGADAVDGRSARPAGPFLGGPPMHVACLGTALLASLLVTLCSCEKKSGNQLMAPSTVPSAATTAPSIVA